jgi:two-component system, cell cycle response regulator DivK
MDMAMPNVDGWEATRRIRVAATEREIAIVAVSAMAEIDGRAAAFRSGCDGFIAKPTTPDVVLEVVRSFTDAPT